MSILVADITSEYRPAPSFSMRQAEGSELPFVTLTEVNGATEVLFDALTEPIAPGEYTLILESFDSLSSDGKPTLFTDWIAIFVLADSCTDIMLEYAAANNGDFEDSNLVLLSNIPEENEKEILIQWPELTSNIDPTCLATIQTELSQLNSGPLGNDWAQIDESERTIRLFPNEEALQALRNDVLVLITVRTVVVSNDDIDEILAEASLTFSIKFEVVGAQDLSEDDQEDTTEVEPEPAEVEEPVSNVSTFAGVVVNETKPKQKKPQQEIPREPITATIALASEKGDVRIEFSRPVIINFGELSNN